jgi:hypothetical protein
MDADSEGIDNAAFQKKICAYIIAGKRQVCAA